MKTELGVVEPTNPYLENMHNQAQERKSKLIRAQQEKEKMEIEQSIALSQMPRILSKNKKGCMHTLGGMNEVRSVDQFMNDQIKFEHRRYENLKNAIIKEEANEQNLYQPSINKKSITIL